MINPTPSPPFFPYTSAPDQSHKHIGTPLSPLPSKLFLLCTGDLSKILSSYRTTLSEFCKDPNILPTPQAARRQQDVYVGAMNIYDGVVAFMEITTYRKSSPYQKYRRYTGSISLSRNHFELTPLTKCIGRLVREILKQIPSSETSLPSFKLIVMGGCDEESDAYQALKKNLINIKITGRPIELYIAFPLIRKPDRCLNIVLYHTVCSAIPYGAFPFPSVKDESLTPPENSLNSKVETAKSPAETASGCSDGCSGDCPITVIECENPPKNWYPDFLLDTPTEPPATTLPQPPAKRSKPLAIT